MEDKKTISYQTMGEKFYLENDKYEKIETEVNIMASKEHGTFSMTDKKTGYMIVVALDDVIVSVAQLLKR